MELVALILVSLLGVVAHDMAQEALNNRNAYAECQDRVDYAYRHMTKREQWRFNALFN